MTLTACRRAARKWPARFGSWTNSRFHPRHRAPYTPPCNQTTSTLCIAHHKTLHPPLRNLRSHSVPDRHTTTILHRRRPRGFWSYFRRRAEEHLLLSRTPLRLSSPCSVLTKVTLGLRQAAHEPAPSQTPHQGVAPASVEHQLVGCLRGSVLLVGHH